MSVSLPLHPSTAWKGQSFCSEALLAAGRQVRLTTCDGRTDGVRFRCFKRHRFYHRMPSRLVENLECHSPEEKADRYLGHPPPPASIHQRHASH